MAQALPDVNTKRYMGKDTYGRDLIADGITSMKRKDGSIEVVDPDKLYVSKQKIVTPMSHEKNMKRNFYNSGMKAVEAYEKKVIDYVSIDVEPAAVTAKFDIK